MADVTDQSSIKVERRHRARAAYAVWPERPTWDDPEGKAWLEQGLVSPYWAGNIGAQMQRVAFELAAHPEAPPEQPPASAIESLREDLRFIDKRVPLEPGVVEAMRRLYAAVEELGKLRSEAPRAELGLPEVVRGKLEAALTMLRRVRTEPHALTEIYAALSDGIKLVHDANEALASTPQGGEPVPSAGDEPRQVCTDCRRPFREADRRKGERLCPGYESEDCKRAARKFDEDADCPACGNPLALSQSDAGEAFCADCRNFGRGAAYMRGCQAAEHEHAREHGELHDRLTTIIDEAFGLQPVQETEELLTFLEHRLRDDRASQAARISELEAQLAAKQAERDEYFTKWFEEDQLGVQLTGELEASRDLVQSLESELAEMTRQRDDFIAGFEREQHLHEETKGYRQHAEQDRDSARERVRELEETLRQIAQWDALNPPPEDGSDLPWLKRLVLAALPKPVEPVAEVAVELQTEECPACKKKDGEVNHPRGMVFVGWGTGWHVCPRCNGSTRIPAAAIEAPLVEPEQPKAWVPKVGDIVYRKDEREKGLAKISRDAFQLGKVKAFELDDQPGVWWDAKELEPAAQSKPAPIVPDVARALELLMHIKRRNTPNSSTWLGHDAEMLDKAIRCLEGSATTGSKS